MKKIEIVLGNKVFPADLNDTTMAGSIYDALPITTSGGFWGDETYF